MHIPLWCPLFLVGHLVCILLIHWWTGKRLSSECFYVFLISLHSWGCGYILDPFLAWLFYWVSHLSLVQNMFLGSFECLITMFYDWDHFISSCCIIWIPNIVWDPPFIKWVCAFDSTHIMRNPQIKEELLLYWSSKFSSILALDANGGEV